MADGNSEVLLVLREQLGHELLEQRLGSHSGAQSSGLCVWGWLKTGRRGSPKIGLGFLLVSLVSFCSKKNVLGGGPMQTPTKGGPSKRERPRLGPVK